MTVQVQDDFLSKEEFEPIYDLIFTDKKPYFPWFYNDHVVYPKDGDYQFVHTFYRNHNVASRFFSLVRPVLKMIQPVSVLRIKANLKIRTDKIIEYQLHNDVRFRCTTAILYVNSNDGYTVFEDGSKIESVANRLVSFPSTTKHAGTTCTDENLRVVINFNYIERDAVGWNYTPAEDTLEEDTFEEDTPA